MDNLFADTWKELNLNTLIKGAGFRKPSDIEINEVVFFIAVVEIAEPVIHSDVYPKVMEYFLKVQKRSDV